MGSVTEKLERREAERLPAQGYAEVRFANEVRVAEFRDLSLTGARLEADDVVPVKVGDVVSVELPVGTAGVVVDAEVVRERRDSGVHELGIRFLRLTGAVAEQIDQYLAAAAALVEAQGP
jgi:hypothetical protein